MFRSAALDTNDRFSYTFTKPGEFTYHCTMHPMMVGKIDLKPAVSSSSAQPDGGRATRSPVREADLNGASSELTFGDGIAAAQIRIARPADRLDEIVAF